MKRIVIVTALVLAASLGRGLFAQAPASGVITRLAGTVELKRAGQTAFTAAKAGDAVAKDTIVSTGFRSTALISLGSSLITVKPLTMLSLAAISAQAEQEKVEFRLHAGRVRVDVKPAEGVKTDLTVRSSAATASVRGTSFEFDTRNLYVSEGTVAFRGAAGGIQRVRAGSHSLVDESNRAEDPIITAAGELTPAAPAGVESGRGAEVPVTEVEFIISLRWN